MEVGSIKGHRVALAIAVLILAVPLLSLGTASAYAPVPTLERRPPSLLALAALGPAKPSGVVTAGPPPPRLQAATANVTLWSGGTQYRVTNNSGAQNEVSIAVNPRNPWNIVASANDYRGGDAWCGVYATRDSGRTWLERLLPRTGNLTPLQAAGDPSVAFDADGAVYQACLAFNRTGDPGNVIAVTKSADGGFTWQTARQVVGTVTDVFHDKQYIGVDASPGPFRGNVYVTWTRFRSGAGECGNYEAPIYLSRSTDGGLTWSPEGEISRTGYRCNQGSEPAVGPWGELYVSWVNYWAGGERVVVVKSTDGGVTFGAPVTVAAMYDPGSLYPGGRPRTPHFPSLAVNPVNGTGGNRLHAVWADRRFGAADILMSTSENGGVAWAAPIRVNDPDGNAQFFPWVATSAGGKVFVSFYDRRDDPFDRLLTVYLATSHDFGRSFARNVRVSAQFDPGDWFIGDYNGLAAMGSFAYPVWCDLRNDGEEEIYMAGPPVIGIIPPKFFVP